MGTSREGWRATEGCFESLWAQFSERFLWIYGMAPDTHGFSHVKIVLFVVYVAGGGGGPADAGFPQAERVPGAAAC